MEFCYKQVTPLGFENSAAVRKVENNNTGKSGTERKGVADATPSSEL